MTRSTSVRFFAGALAFALSTAPLIAQLAEGPIPTTALISVETKNGATLDPTMLKLQINRHVSPITAVTPVAPASAQIAILIDDGLRSSFSLQIDDFKNFILGLPAGTKVMVGYMQNGTVRSASQGFTKDRDEVIGQLRIPMSVAGVSASPYFCLSEFVKHWPSNEPGSRFVLMVTNGIDPYNGRPSILNQDSPYVQQAQEDAQRAGVAVYSIYSAESGMRGGSFSGQSYLSQVAEATGGQTFNQGTIPPPSFSPFLKEFSKYLAESYVVSFQAPPLQKHDTLQQIKLTTSQQGVKVHAPQGVRPGDPRLSE